jgi:hypothetical protein
MRTLSAIFVLALSAPAIAQGITSEIEQIGTGHGIELSQVPAGLDLPATLVSSIKQTGADQTAKVLQRGHGDDARSTVTQHGQGNLSEVTQGSNTGGFFDATILHDARRTPPKLHRWILAATIQRL